MTLITMQEGKVIMKAGAVGTETACCCPNGVCVDQMCENSGWICTVGANTFRIATIIFDADLTSPCLSPFSPYDANGDCITTAIDGFNQLFFACQTGTNDNKVWGMFYNAVANAFVGGAGGLLDEYAIKLGCVNGRLSMSFFARTGSVCFGASVASSPDEALVDAFAAIDFGPMPVDCDDIDGLTASGFIFRSTSQLYIPPPGIDGYQGWVSTGGIAKGCGYDLPQEALDLACPDSYIPFTATISLAFNAAYSATIGCA